MADQQSARNDGQDISPSETPRYATSAQQAYHQYPSAASQHQFEQTAGQEPLQMSSLQGALPSVQSPGYASARGYPAMSPAPYPIQAHAPSYHSYPQSPTQHGGVQYPGYYEQQAPGLQYSPVQTHFGGPPMYTNPSQVQQYGVYAPGYGPPSPVHQRAFQGHPRAYSGHEYMQPVGQTAPTGAVAYPQGTKQPPTNSPVPSAPRGPPRKPKQSGHALWVGNLPPGTRVNDLKDHFAREATKDIESVFLISKSNCAFVNYRSEEACAAAMTRFHDSRFQGVRLVTRLRRAQGASPSPSSGTIGAGISGPPGQDQASSTQSQTAVEAIAHNRESSQKATEAAQSPELAVNDKYFIVKSLTVEDLELSARNGIWATQGHNEDALIMAYEKVENVYLIFSANKSGEYFGYARMSSSINDEIASTLEWKQHESEPKTTAMQVDPELPRSIPTLATEWAPKGHIIDDSARGTNFWEAESEESEEESRETRVDGEATTRHEESSESDGGEEKGSSATKLADDIQDPFEASHQSFGRPFRVQWVSTNRLPFYRTRGLRNAWNANREVKIARDGTELETNVGRRLVSMFHRPAAPPPANMHQTQHFMGQVPAPLGYGIPPYPGRY